MLVYSKQKKDELFLLMLTFGDWAFARFWKCSNSSLSKLSIKLPNHTKHIAITENIRTVATTHKYLCFLKLRNLCFISSKKSNPPQDLATSCTLYLVTSWVSAAAVLEDEISNLKNDLLLQMKKPIVYSECKTRWIHHYPSSRKQKLSCSMACHSNGYKRQKCITYERERTKFTNF